jgi:hypothetical protein
VTVRVADELRSLIVIRSPMSRLSCRAVTLPSTISPGVAGQRPSVRSAQRSFGLAGTDCCCTQSEEPVTRPWDRKLRSAEATPATVLIRAARAACSAGSPAPTVTTTSVAAVRAMTLCSKVADSPARTVTEAVR